MYLVLDAGLRLGAEADALLRELGLLTPRLQVPTWHSGHPGGQWDAPRLQVTAWLESLLSQDVAAVYLVLDAGLRLGAEADALLRELGLLTPRLQVPTWHSPLEMESRNEPLSRSCNLGILQCRHRVADNRTCLATDPEGIYPQKSASGLGSTAASLGRRTSTPRSTPRRCGARPWLAGTRSRPWEWWSRRRENTGTGRCPQRLLHSLCVRRDCRECFGHLRAV